MSSYIKLRDGRVLGKDITALDCLYSFDPNTYIFPKGYRDLLRSEHTRAWVHLCSGGKVGNFKFRNIIEKNFEHVTEKRAW